MAIIALRAWYLPQYEPLEHIEQRPHDLRLNKSSLLKTALRADFLDDLETVQRSEWFQRYRLGETVEFYIEGSGSYTIANIDVLSHEIYFIKSDRLSYLEPTLFFSPADSPSSDEIRTALKAFVTNTPSRFPLELVESPRSATAPLRLDSPVITQLRRSLLFIADGSGNEQLHAMVALELGYALASKRRNQLLVIQQEHPSQRAPLPIEVPSRQRLIYSHSQELAEKLPTVLQTLLEPFDFH
ncbi:MULTISPECIES: hypothetical protein [unclassified Thermosynechococcus]|uniref:hypothetical protein n=1 Tax=unclassified Thermosynechococcus TaxID=2622553 RepID=UPI0028736CA3|nr:MULTISPECIES: hypothetical protein [unclassified Thermosynechococcus]WNC31450.1 hypothetical protein RHH81_07300 [Thermosynechococcus sp. PKX95]WNC33974.1 hypothetical protein RHH79_07295 [Thermosynechococcus sp. PKX91]WNC36498.1 hypothetical protein RHI11_07300 [Thermosynechococcus sp. WL11]WNC39019.1 hypothetical protein RHI18_07300 [Thermosynechococcus sp. WL17]WNC41541.1 hypothetical protein RHI14_07295 [Thermosynechococcus sp. WL15]